MLAQMGGLELVSKGEIVSKCSISIAGVMFEDACNALLFFNFFWIAPSSQYMTQNTGIPKCTEVVYSIIYMHACTSVYLATFIVHEPPTDAPL